MQIDAKSVSVRLGAITALDGVDFHAATGEMIGLIGPNGSGKTTLLRVIANLLRPDRGEVLYAGQTAATIGTSELSRRIAYLAQGGEVHWPMRVEALIGLGRLPHRKQFGRLSTVDQVAIDRAMQAADVHTLRQRTMNNLSGGERMRVLLARALAVEGELLLADEPVAALDPLHQLEVMELLRRKTAAGGGVVVVLHDLSLAARYCDRLVLLSNGRVLAAGLPADVLTDENLAAAFGVNVIRGERDGVPFVLPWSLSSAISGPSA